MGNDDELRDYVGRLVRAPWEGAFLIVTVAGGEDFLQMLLCGGRVQIDFPMVTARQRGLEPRIRATAEREGLTIEEVRGSDGARFLDMYLEKDADAASRACRTFLREVFGAGEDTRLEFKGDGLAA